MPDPRPALVDIVARAIADSDEYPGYWTDLTDAIGNSSPGADTRPLEACAAMYQREAMAALAAMPQPVGYGVKIGNSGWYGPHQSLTHAQKVAGFYGGNATVVALVPAEDQ